MDRAALPPAQAQTILRRKRADAGGAWTDAGWQRPACAL